LTTDRRLRLRR